MGQAVLLLGIAAGLAGLLDGIFLVIKGHADASGDIWKGPIGSWPYRLPGHNKPGAQIKNPTLDIFFPSQKVNFRGCSERS